MQKNRIVAFVLVVLALALSAQLANVMASEPKINCTDIAGCTGGASCGAGATTIVDCAMVCVGGGTVWCDVITQ